MLGGSDQFELASGRTDGSLTVNVDGGAPAGPGSPSTTDNILIDGTTDSDTFQVSPGATSDAGRISTQLFGATAPTVLNFTTTENVQIDGGGGASPDSVSLDGTGSNNAFAVAAGSAQVDSHSPVRLSNLGADSTLNLNGLGGTNSFSVDQATGASFANVNINGGPAGDSSAAITGTSSDDTIDFVPATANSGTLSVNATDYQLAGVTSASIDALARPRPIP